MEINIGSVEITIRERHNKRHKPAFLGLIFPNFNPRSYSVNATSIPLGEFALGTIAYLNADGTPSLDSNGAPIPLVGPITVSDISDTTNLSVVVNSDNTLAVGVGDTAPVPGSATFTFSDASPTPFTGTATITYGAAVPVGTPASLGIVFTGPFPTAPTS